MGFRASGPRCHTWVPHYRDPAPIPSTTAVWTTGLAPGQVGCVLRWHSKASTANLILHCCSELRRTTRSCAKFRHADCGTTGVSTGDQPLRCPFDAVQGNSTEGASEHEREATVGPNPRPPHRGSRDEARGHHHSGHRQGEAAAG